MGIGDWLAYTLPEFVRFVSPSRFSFSNPGFWFLICRHEQATPKACR
jgi:hypothetical protein